MIPEPYRTLADEGRTDSDDCCGMTVEVRIMKQGSWRWGPFVGGVIHWGRRRYRVFGTPLFSIWLDATPKRSTPR